LADAWKLGVDEWNTQFFSVNKDGDLIQKAMSELKSEISLFY
jgi:hypothetical protein